MADLVVTLTSPTGTAAVILNRKGGTGNNLFRARFDDDVDSSLVGITSSQAPFIGTWKPDNPLGVFNGEVANGVWTLRIEDKATSDTGSLQQWSLHFNSIGATAGPGRARAVITAPQTASNGQSVSLDGSFSLFVDSYSWNFVSIPSGSGAVIANPTGAATSFVVDREGIYTVRLTVTNASGSNSVTQNIAVSNQAPQVSVSSVGPVLFPAAANFNGQVSDDGLPIPSGALTYQWMQISGPGSVTFANALQEDTTATFTVPGIYSLSLAVSDGALTSSATITVEVDDTLVTIGNVGNPADPVTGRGAVNYEYRIGKFEVTNAQYSAFLNAVAAVTDSLGLYDSGMAGPFIGGIIRSGNPGSFRYELIANRENQPVGYIEFFDAVRYVNWLHNGAVPGGATESGAYTLTGNSPIPANSSTVVRNAGATFWIPSENEWYKAAYHQPASDSGPSDNFWQFATRSDIRPTGQLPPGIPPAAALNNFGTASQKPPVDVGSYTSSSSHYNTFECYAAVLAPWLVWSIPKRRKAPKPCMNPCASVDGRSRPSAIVRALV